MCVTRSRPPVAPTLRRSFVLSCCVWLVGYASAAAQIGAPAPPATTVTAPPTNSVAPPAPLTHYQGREIALTMHYEGAPWLVREERQREEDGATMLQQLQIKPGMTVVDFGCGNGFYTLELARLVGPQGRVLAVDIQPEMLRLMEARAATEQLRNIAPILATPVDPQLPPATVDVALLVDVYHELSYPEHVLTGLRRSLKPTGVVALVEFRAEDAAVPIKPLHKMSKTQILKEWQPNGFRLVREYDQLPWQHLMFFAPQAP